MRSISRTLTTVGVIAAVIAIGIFLGWLASRPPTAPLPLLGSTPEVTGPLGTNTPQISKNTTTSTGTHTAGTHTLPDTGPLVPVVNTNLITDWEDRVDEILRDNADVEEKAREMLKIFPRMTEQGQIDTAQHISNLLDDKDYPEFGRYLADPKTPGGVLDVLMTDVLNRPNSMKMPLLLEVACNSDHPKAAEAKETLEFYLEEDYGKDCKLWEEKVNEWLKENPD